MKAKKGEDIDKVIPELQISRLSCTEKVSAVKGLLKLSLIGKFPFSEILIVLVLHLLLAFHLVLAAVVSSLLAGG